MVRSCDLLSGVTPLFSDLEIHVHMTVGAQEARPQETVGARGHQFICHREAHGPTDKVTHVAGLFSRPRRVHHSRNRIGGLSLTLVQLSVLVNLQMPLAPQLGRQGFKIRPTDNRSDKPVE